MLQNSLYPVSNNSLALSYNPFMKNYDLFCDISKFSANYSGINLKFKSSLDGINLKNKETYKILNDTIIDSSLIISKKKIIISKGIEIEFQNNASLVATNCDFISKDNNEKIRWIARDNNSLIFINCNLVEIDNNFFIGFSNNNSEGFNLTSAITFYNSNVEIFNSIF